MLVYSSLKSTKSKSDENLSIMYQSTPIRFSHRAGANFKGENCIPMARYLSKCNSASAERLEECKSPMLLLREKDMHTVPRNTISQSDCQDDIIATVPSPSLVKNLYLVSTSMTVE